LHPAAGLEAPWDSRQPSGQAPCVSCTINGEVLWMLKSSNLPAAGRPYILLCLVDQKSLHIAVLANVQFFLQFFMPVGGIFRQYLFSRLVTRCHCRSGHTSRGQGAYLCTHGRISLQVPGPELAQRIKTQKPGTAGL